MLNFFVRLWNILRGRTGALIDRLERPEDQLNLFLAQLGDQVQDLQRSVATAIADEKRLQKEIEALTARANDWEARAALALQEGNEDLARTALARQEECESETAALRGGWQAQKQATARLKESLKVARSRMDEARRKYNLLLAQFKSAQTRKTIQQSLNGATADSPVAMLEALEEKIRRVESEAEAELALGASVLDGDVEAQFRRLEQGRKGDERLRQLKARLGAEGRLEAASGSAEPAIDLKRNLDRG
jgi:phage shock protein A